MIQTIKDYYSFDPSEKNKDWAKKKVEHYLTQWRPLINGVRAKKNMDLVFGLYDNKEVKELFEEWDKTGVDFAPLNIWEKLRNIFVAECELAGIRIECMAVDPTAVTERDKDRELLVHGAEMEEFMNYFGGKIGAPPFSIKHKKGMVSGNVDEFSSNGLDSNSVEDLDYFFRTLYRLRHEIAAEIPIAQALAENECQQMLPKLCTDMIAKKIISLITFVDDNTGAIRISYIAPENVYAIPGKREDFKDAVCIGYKEPVNIADFIARMGSEFDWKKDIPDLLLAVNNQHNRSYTGVGTDNNFYGEPGSVCSMNEFMAFSISLGYIEWKECDADTYKVTKKNKAGNPRIRKTKYDTTLETNSYYKKKNYFNVYTYRAYFLITTGAGEVKLFKYGKLPWQQIEGLNEELSNYTFCIYKESGKSAAEISEYYVTLAEKIHKKYQYLLMEIKPPGYSFNVHAMEALLDAAITRDGPATTTDMMKVFEKSKNHLHSNIDGNGDNMGGDGYPNKEISNGLALLTAAMREMSDTFDKCISDFKSQLGISPGREGYAPDPRDGYRVQMQSLEGSINATRYINKALQNVFKVVGEKVHNYSQYIIKYKKINSIPYDRLVLAIGQKNVNDMEYLGEIAAHRYGIFIRPFNDKYNLEKQRMYAEQAFANKEIRIEQLMLVNSIDNPKKAAQVLAFEQRRNLRDAEKALDAASKRKMAQDDNLYKRQMEFEQVKIAGNNQKADIEGRWYYLAHVNAAKWRFEGQQDNNEARSKNIQEKAEANIAEVKAAKELEQVAPQEV